MSLGARSQIFLPCVELSRQSQEQGEREREKDKQRECHIGSEAKVVSERNTQSLSLWSVCVGSTWWREGRKFVTVTAYPSLSISYPFSSWKALFRPPLSHLLYNNHPRSLRCRPNTTERKKWREQRSRPMCCSRIRWRISSLASISASPALLIGVLPLSLPLCIYCSVSIYVVHIYI